MRRVGGDEGSIELDRRDQEAAKHHAPHLRPMFIEFGFAAILSGLGHGPSEGSRDSCIFEIVFTGKQHLRRKTADNSILVESESQFPVEWSFECLLQFKQCSFYYLLPLFVLPYPNCRLDTCSLSCANVYEATTTSLLSLQKIKFIFVRIIVVLTS
jgi:hypothetical protein